MTDPKTAALAELLASGADLTPVFNQALGGFERLIGITFTKVSADEVSADVPVTPALHQPYGIIHGGVYSAIAETIASVGAAVNALAHGQATVGLENTTSFLRAVRSGTLHARALPQHRGHRTQMWTVEITDDEGRLVSSARVRMLSLEGGATIAGEAVALKDRE